MFDFVSDPYLESQVSQLPPRQLRIDNVPRTRSREITVSQATELSRRGIRGFLLSFDGCVELTPSHFQELVQQYGAEFDDPSDSESLLYVFGRREGREDTRILVACITYLRR